MSEQENRSDGGEVRELEETHENPQVQYGSVTELSRVVSVQVEVVERLRKETQEISEKLKEHQAKLDLLMELREKPSGNRKD